MRRNRLWMSSGLCLAAITSVLSCSSSPSGGQAGGRPTGSDPTTTSRASATPSDDADTTNPPLGGGRIAYTGVQSGSVQFDSAVCSVLDGTFSAIIAPDDTVEPSPKAHLTSNHTGDLDAATFSPSLADAEHSYVRIGADGITAAEHDGVWTVTLSNTELDTTTGEGGTVTLNGMLICSRVEGT